MNYNFQKNLLKASESNDIMEAKTEWEMISEQKLQREVLCICNHKIKNVAYFFNSKTKNVINIGTTCKNKFGMGSIPKIKNKLILKFISEKIKNTEYGCITDIKIYCEEVQKEFYKYLNDKIEGSKDNRNELNIYKEQILELKNLNLGLDFDDILGKINCIQIEKIKIEERKLREIEEKKTKDLKDLIERKSKENEEKNIKPITTKISNQINNYECKCGIEFVNICKCQKPNYELYFNNLWCSRCDKSKCRCTQK